MEGKEHSSESASCYWCWHFWVLCPIDFYSLMPCFQSRELTPPSSRQRYFRSAVLQHWSRLLSEWWKTLCEMAFLSQVCSRAVRPNAVRGSFAQRLHSWIVLGRMQVTDRFHFWGEGSEAFCLEAACWAPEPV